MAEGFKADCAFFTALTGEKNMAADEALAAAKQAKQGKPPHETPAGEANCGNPGSSGEADPMQGQPGLLSDQPEDGWEEMSDVNDDVVTVSHVKDVSHRSCR
eukprot:scaffold155985_cov13-Prasinocladus_malaysianus.AAC.1